MTQPHRNPATGLSLATGPARPKHLPCSHLQTTAAEETYCCCWTSLALSLRLSVGQLSPNLRSPAASKRACFSHINNRKADRYKSVLNFTWCFYNPFRTYGCASAMCAVKACIFTGVNTLCLLFLSWHTHNWFAKKEVGGEEKVETS